MKKISNKAYWCITCMCIVVVLGVISMVTIFLDPYFHYHKPIDETSYTLYNERYQNDGISRNFEYDTIITGSSMVQNFKTSECDEIFGVNSIKVPFSGATYKEINDNLKRAFQSDNSIKYVIRCLDYSRLVQPADSMNESVEFPEYMTNDTIYDDVHYFLNKTIIYNDTLKMIFNTISGKEPTSFDDYSNTTSYFTYGKQSVLESYSLGEKKDVQRMLTDEEVLMIRENIRENVVKLAEEQTDTQFYLFFPPYSICYWDELNQNNEIDWRIQAEKIAIEELLDVSNIKLYSFCDNAELVCNLNNYKDQAHYGEWINSDILQWIKSDVGIITEENYLQYINNIEKIYTSYDYETLHMTENGKHAI